MTTLYFIRHGQTDWNAAARLQGQTDTELNAKGVAQARDNGQRLFAHFSDANIRPCDLRYVMSPLTRTRSTAQRIAEALGFEQDPFEPVTDLAEIRFGHWEGKTRDEIRAAAPEDYARYEQDMWGYQPPNGESYEMLARRVLDWLSTLSGPTVCVSHGGVMRVLRSHFEDVPKADAPMLKIPQNKIYMAQAGKVVWL